MNTRAPARRYDSVQQDWRAFLPEAKFGFYHTHSGELQQSCFMLGVALDEALAFRKNGQITKAIQAMELAPELCEMFVLRLTSVLHAMRQQARHFGVVPNLVLLDVSNFHTDRAQRTARFSILLGHVLLSERSQFIHKISALEQIAQEVRDIFVEAKHRLELNNANSAVLWESLKECNFDLNTCLSETLVLVKSFLFVLPEEQLDMLDFTIRGLCRARPVRHLGPTVIHARRIAVLAGK